MLLLYNYNQWFLDQDYRQKIAHSLGLKYSEESLTRVVGQTDAGAGSSFDKYKFFGQANQMRVLERWKNMADNSNYRSLFLDPEVWTLSEQIFGYIPNTEVLRS